jgi:AcrR family transcriptional regulator
MTTRQDNASREAAKDKRLTIIDAAQAVLRRKGITNATVDDIAQRAGVAKGTVYLYFKTKEDIFVEMVVHKSSQTLDAAKKAAEEASGTWEKLRAAMRIHFKGISEHMPNPLIGEGMLRLTAAQKKKLIRAKLAHVEFYEGIISEHFARSRRKPPFSPRASALALVGGLVGYVFQRHHFEDEAVSPEEYLRTYEAVVQAALVGGEIESEKSKGK